MAIAALSALMSGLSLMLAVGIVHHEMTSAVPTIGYWWAVLLASLLRSAAYVPDWSKEDGHR